MDMNFNKKELEILSDALDELNYRLDMQLGEWEDYGDFYSTKGLAAKLQEAYNIHNRISAALALEIEIEESNLKSANEQRENS